MSADARIIPVGAELAAMEPSERPERRNARPDGDAANKPKQKPGRRSGAIRRRFALLNSLVDTSLPLLKGRADFAAWLQLYRHAKPDGTAKASITDMARRAACSESAMRRGLKRLQSAGLLERIKRGTLAGGPSVWRLLTPDGDRP